MKTRISATHLTCSAPAALYSPCLPQGASLFYFTEFDSPTPRGIIPIENAEVLRGERAHATTDRRDKYLIKIVLDPTFEAKREFYLLSARSNSGYEGWLAVRRPTLS